VIQKNFGESMLAEKSSNTFVTSKLHYHPKNQVGLQGAAYLLFHQTRVASLLWSKQTATPVFI
jgi:hypothetical protein